MFLLCAEPTLLRERSFEMHRNAPYGHATRLLLRFKSCLEYFWGEQQRKNIIPIKPNEFKNDVQYFYFYRHKNKNTQIT